MLQWKFFRYRAVAVTWLLIMTFLFFLPGSALPKEAWLEEIYFDKWVHVGLFAVLIFLWRSAFGLNTSYYNGILLFAAVLYGLSVEFIQLNWVPNRSFDLFDLLADTIGSFLGLLLWLRVYRKK
jgi:hypothetical protein